MIDDFHTTHWSMVIEAGRKDSAGADAALSDLCEAYWYPLYAYARRRGLPAEEAEDRTQGFFAALLEKEWIVRADPERGRFRAFLLTAFKRHLGRERARERTQRRGGGRTTLRLDFEDGERRYSLEPTHVDTPERLFDRRWALTLLAGTMGRLAAEFEEDGKAELFREIKVFLPGADAAGPQAEIAERLGMTTGAVKVAVHRLRTRYRECLRTQIAQTVESASEIDEELGELLASL